MERFEANGPLGESIENEWKEWLLIFPSKFHQLLTLTFGCQKITEMVSEISKYLLKDGGYFAHMITENKGNLCSNLWL